MMVASFRLKAYLPFLGNPGVTSPKEGVDPAELDHCAFLKVYENGALLVDETLDTVRRRVREDV